MTPAKEVKRFQEFLMNAWPAEHYFFLNGWILRFIKGVTYRANSVIPINYTGNSALIENDIKMVENAYKSFKLPTIFTMHEYFEPKELDGALRNRGYVEQDRTKALLMQVSNLDLSHINKDFTYEVHNERVKDFSSLLAKFTKRDKYQQEIIKEITNRIVVPKKCFVIAKLEGKPIGSLMGVLNPHGYVYIADVFVVPKFRRQKIASSMLKIVIKEWAIRNGAENIWLQVELKNHNAMKLYENLGMKEAYSYYYLRKDNV
ncbi:MAG: GNAT family N-acetyltransferase [Candidatus Lokiarchaeota archaeon]|nr:GNAT family N-acetyltransferase [Candidatus Lokiarchaeota archaeon]